MYITVSFACLRELRSLILTGNGTQKAFWSDPDVLYISVHVHEGGAFYPGGVGGGSDQVGEGAGLGRYALQIPSLHCA